MSVRGWLAGRTLRTRLTAGILVLLVVSCAGIGIATSITLQGFLVTRLDQQLVEAGSRLDVSLESPGGPSGPGPVPPGGARSFCGATRDRSNRSTNPQVPAYPQGRLPAWRWPSCPAACRGGPKERVSAPLCCSSP